MLNLFLANDKSLLSELCEYLTDKYFSANMPYLENFKVESTALISLRIIIIGITIGLIIAAFASIYNKRYLGDFVRLLIDMDCLDAKRAMTLEELGYKKNVVIRSVIKSGGTLSRWVRCSEEDEYYEKNSNQKTEVEEENSGMKKNKKSKASAFVRNCDTMHFYLPEDKKYAAEVKFEAKGTNFGMAILVTLASIALCMFLCYILPDAIKMVDNFISVMNK